ncbi:MAG: Ty1/Copia family ribonuclease HI, partial [Ilumatobacteraceae bacterium]|nr:Ty1/Copia family ribonuclease HI [Ilumatobacteraceae bacterium]
LLDKVGQKYVQAVTGTLLYYSRAVDPTMLVALNAIATQQAAPTQRTMARVKQLLDYCASQEEAVLTYHSSDMILAVHSDAGYLNESKSRSRAGGHFFMSSDTQYPPNNGAALTIVQIIDAVMSSAAEAELGALFINAKEAVVLRRILSEMGHPQLRTPIQTDNSTAEGVINSRVKPRRTKSMDMRFEWLLDRQQQGQFKIYWRSGKTNLADYFTKHHPPSHHRNIRGEYLTRVSDLHQMRQAKNFLEAGLAMTDGTMFPRFSARVC